MAETTAERRRRVAALIGDLYAGKRSLNEVMRSVSDFDPPDDPELAELLRLVASEPASTWLFGVTGESHRQSSVRIRELVSEFAR
jgi:hypothetical protein